MSKCITILYNMLYLPPLFRLNRIDSTVLCVFYFICWFIQIIKFPLLSLFRFTSLNNYRITYYTLRNNATNYGTLRFILVLLFNREDHLPYNGGLAVMTHLYSISHFDTYSDRRNYSHNLLKNRFCQYNRFLTGYCFQLEFVQSK